ncbi:hypothetical protein PVAND_008730 [Polypedilum vanderplanki]|uniref:beta-mannosidase n=1 Tax=Polypedilum vanderplanki TaxID=319348 RepID=A0A9J6CAP6_POLVA|nr:hypothetical protein PVAND_008730 [Polypedilum vanderplanki]
MRVALLLLISTCLVLHGTEAISIPLQNDWILKNSDRDIEIKNIQIPSGIFSDLEAANVTESILFSYNDVKLRKFSYSNWSYSLNFNMTQEDLNHTTMILVFHGLDTITEIFLNDVLLGSTNNMFIRYRFDVKNHLFEGENHLIINFQSPIEAAKKIKQSLSYSIPPECPPEVYNGECHINLLRKMQASFGWDWGLAVPSMGIWKNVEIEIYDSLNIRDITYELTKISEPTIEESDLVEENWNISLKIFVESGMENAHVKGALIYELSGISGPYTEHKDFKTNKNGKGILKVTIQIKSTDVNYWWPNGYGKQNLYTFKVKWEDEQANDVNFYSKSYYIAQKSINIGFRTIELVQDRMDNGLSFYFRINGIDIFMKGSNWIPASILPEKLEDTTKIKELLQAARDANLNMLRVWGGGVYESDYFYNLADEYGILIWQDMMFACAMYSADEEFLKSVKTEIRHQIRRIQHHPSIALFADNNENEVALRQGWYATGSNYSLYASDYNKLYVKTITKELLSIDKNRPILTSSPSNGAWIQDKDKFGISLDPQNQHFGDIHFYPVGTNSWHSQSFHQARFASEFGFQSFPQGWKDVVRKNESILELIEHRQHHPLRNSIISSLIEKNINVEFEKLEWEDQVYLSQISQAIALKIETEVYRKGRGNFMNTMGALYWQLNDVWTAPSWSSIEFNGNFKIAHFWMTQVFAPLSIITHLNDMNKLTIYGVSDEINVQAKKMTVKMNIFKWNSLTIADTLEWKFMMKPNAVTEVTNIEIYNYLHDKNFDVRECLLMFYLYDDSDNSTAIANNFIFPGKYQNLLINDPNLRFSFSSNKCEKEKHQIFIEIKIDSPAVFIYITFNHENIKKYRLSKNGFIQVSPIQNVQLTFDNPNCHWNITIDDLKIKTFNKYL